MVIVDSFCFSSVLVGWLLVCWIELTWGVWCLGGFCRSECWFSWLGFVDRCGYDVACGLGYGGFECFFPCVFVFFFGFLMRYFAALLVWLGSGLGGYLGGYDLVVSVLILAFIWV